MLSTGFISPLPLVDKTIWKAGHTLTLTRDDNGTDSEDIELYLYL